jgi:hypothetical protein
MEAPIADGGEGKQMDRITGSGPAVTDVPDPTPERGKRHFDTFETEFFQQGDDAGSAPEVDRFEDLDDGGGRRRFAPSRQLMVGVAVGSTCLAVLGCVALWRSGNRPISAVQEPATRLSEPALAGTPVTAKPGASPAPSAPGGAAAAQAPVPAVPAPPAAAPPAQAEPPAAVVATDRPSPSNPTVAAAPAAAEKPAPPQAEERAAGSDAPAAPAASEAAAARARCKQAVSRRHSKEIQAACEEAFMADPGAADIAILLAKTEYDRGRAAQAAAWSRKALAVDSDAADAYVFIGGAEQSAGRSKAAKEAYRRYLQLAPNGRYAADLRAIVSSL